MNLEEKFNDYLTYQEAIKQAVVPGYKSDWPDKEVESNDSDESEDDS